MKDDGGTVGLTESPAALQRWMVSGPEMARLINDFESAVNHAQVIIDRRHHEQRLMRLVNIAIFENEWFVFLTVKCPFKNSAWA